MFRTAPAGAASTRGLHPTSTYPTSWEYIERSLVDCTPEEKQMILVETPRRLYHLPEGY